MNKSEKFKKAHKRAKELYLKVSYREKFSIALKEINKAEKVAAEPVVSLEFSIPFSDAKLRDLAKRVGCTWNAARKVWVLSAKRSQVNERLLAVEVKPATAATTTTTTTWLVDGKEVKNSLNYSEMYNRYGMDFE